MDRNNIIGIVLIFVLFIVWQQVTAPSKEQIEAQKRYQDSVALVQERADSLARIAKDQAAVANQPSVPEPVADLPDSLLNQQLVQSHGIFAPSAKGEEKTITLENELSKVSISTKGARINAIELKEHFKVLKDSARQDYKVPLVLMDDEKNRFEYFLPISNLPAGGVASSGLYFRPVENTKSKLVLRADAGQGRYIDHIYELIPNSYKIDFKINMQGLNGLLSAEDALELTWINYIDRIEKAQRLEQMNSSLHFREVGETPDHCSFTGNDEESSKGNPVQWVAAANQFFTTAFIADQQAFAQAELSSETLKDEQDDLKRYVSKIYLPYDRNDASVNYDMTIYSGPNEFKRLYAFDNNLEDVIPYGWNIFGTINRWVIRPLFEWLSTFIGSKGIVILILTLIVKLALYPLTYRMLYSQSKMQALKPEIEKMKAKYKDDAQKTQMETMKLYREFGANPLGSCLPMLAQLPIWFALYRFFPAAIDFRQEGFLWANDLSSYDEFIQLSFTIPLGFGSHISLFTVLWALTTLLYTYYNSRHMDLSAQPAMKYMQYLMPLFFMGFFNSYSSGLTAYLLFSNVINITQTLVTKNFIIDQKKILADMEAYRKKPKKKGGFQERLQKALEEQRKIQDQQQKKGGKNKKR